MPSMKRSRFGFQTFKPKAPFHIFQIWFKFERHTSYSTHSAYILTHTALDANPAYSLRPLDEVEKNLGLEMGLWCVWLTRPLGTPRGRCDAYSGKFSLSKKPRFIEPVGAKKHVEGWWRRDVVRRNTRDSGANVEPAQHNQTLCPNLTVRLSISPACCKQRIKRMVWRMMFVCKKQQKTMIAVDCISDVKEWTGVHSSLVVSLQ